MTSAQILEFPLKGKKGIKSKKHNNDNIIRSPRLNLEQPNNRQECLEMYKKHLDADDYEEVILSIMDKDYYNLADEQIRDLVDNYFNYE